MIVYAVLGSAPLYMGQPIVEAGVSQGLVSFYDHPKAYKSLSQLNSTILEKINERKIKHQSSGSRQDRKHGKASTGKPSIHTGFDSHQV